MRWRFVPAAVALALALAGMATGCTGPASDPDRLWDPGPWPPRQELLPHAVRVPCETAVLDAGEPAWRPLLGDGFFGDESWGDGPEARSFAWAGPAAEATLLVAEPGARELVVTGRAAGPATTVAAELDGRELGRRPVPAAWSQIRWQIPQELASAGPHRLRLVSSRAERFEGDPRALSLAVDRIELSPAADCAVSGRPPERLGDRRRGGGGGGGELTGRSIELAPGEALVAPLSVPPEGTVRVTLAPSAGGDSAASAPAAALEALLLRGDGAVALGEPRPAPPSAADPAAPGRAVEWSLTGCCEPGETLVLTAANGAPVRLGAVTITGDRRPSAWRRACGVLRWETAGSLLLLAVTAAWLRRLRRRPGPAGQPPRWRPWLDAALVAAIATAVRLLFLQVYPEPGRSADAYEYLMRSARLASGKLSFLHDTGWHAWQTWVRPPGYYLFLAALRDLGGEVAAIRLQALACGIAAGATYLAGWRLFGRLAGWAAGLGFALYVESIVTFSRILTEPLYMLFVVPGLAALAWVSVRPDWRPAALAGVLFGLGALVRSAPFWYVPLAALALMAAAGPRRGWRPALAMVGAMALVVAPWILRNSWIAGAPAGIDDLTVVNLLQVNPDDRFVRHSDLDLGTGAGWRTYYNRLQQGNRNGALSSQAGEVARATLAGLAERPGRTAATLGRNLVTHFEIYKTGFFGHTHGERDLCRVRWVTDLMNLQHWALLALAAAGLALTVRDRRTWPLALWLVFNTLVINLLFHPEPKYRLPTIPVAMIWAGAAVAAVAGRLPRPGGRGRPGGGAGEREALPDHRALW